MLPPSGEFRFSWVRECQRFVHSLLRDTKDTNAVDKGEREKEREREREKPKRKMLGRGNKGLKKQTKQRESTDLHLKELC